MSVFIPPLWSSEVPCFGAPCRSRQTHRRCRRYRRRPSRWWRMSLYVWTDTTAAPLSRRLVAAAVHRQSLEGGEEMSRQEITKNEETLIEFYNSPFCLWSLECATL